MQARWACRLCRHEQLLCSFFVCPAHWQLSAEQPPPALLPLLLHQNFLALIPLALLLGDVTEDLAVRFGDTVGG